MDDLIQQDSRKTWASSKDQARGGVVALLRAGQQNLSPRDFKQFVTDVPGADKLLKNAPPPSALSSLAGGLGSLLGGASRAAGRWAGLAASFAELGIDLDTAQEVRADRHRLRAPARRRRPGRQDPRRPQGLTASAGAAAS